MSELGQPWSEAYAETALHKRSWMSKVHHAALRIPHWSLPPTQLAPVTPQNAARSPCAPLEELATLERAAVDGT